MNLPIPEGKYIKSININEKSLDIDFLDRKKVALVFISLNSQYWPYLNQVVKDCRQNFLPQHSVDYFAWTDFTSSAKEKMLNDLKKLVSENAKESVAALINPLVQIIRLYEQFYPTEIREFLNQLSKQGLALKRDGANHFLESTHEPSQEDSKNILQTVESILSLAYTDMATTLKGVKLIETEPVEWPAPTLMRYHLFLNEEEALKDYDYIFYLDADMRVVSKVSDEILGEDLTLALHPMYDLNPTFVPPYEPNKDSTAFIPRLGQLIDNGGKPRFRPLYLAGGFQGGKSAKFIEAMKAMKKSIDKDFDNGYTAIWNDESHWNKYVFESRGPIVGNEVIVLGPEYVYPDSLIKEYYEPRWGRKLEPKIITLTKPFSLSSTGAEELNQLIGK